jgi:hypothetical protein
MDVFGFDSTGERVVGLAAEQLPVRLCAGLEEDHPLPCAGVEYLVACLTDLSTDI